MNKSVLYLKGLIEGFTINSEDSEFEWQHFKDVNYHAQILAYDRHMDENLTLLIAIGHDLGRLKGGISGKGHAKESTKLLKKLLADNDYLGLFHENDIKMVQRAIKNHSHKHRLDDAYSELIKDADTLAHMDEKLLVEKDAPEFFRYRALKSSIKIDQVAPVHNWIRAFEKLSGDLAHSWRFGFVDGHETEWVHHMRTTTRKLRSILIVLRELGTLFSEPTVTQKLNEYEVNLIKVLKYLEDARRFAVLMALDGYDKDQNILKPLYKEELVKLKYLIESERDLVISPMISFELIECENWQENCQNTINKILKKYLFSASKLDLDNVKKIHKLRILGKQLKYLFELGLIENSNVHLSEIVYEYHNIAGEIHDLEDAIEFKHAKLYFDLSKLKAIQKRYQKQIEKFLLFFNVLVKNSQ